jgi:hypothetical protein
VKDISRARLVYGAISVTYGFSLYLFYFKYVPFLKTFQLVFSPILLTVLVLTAINARWGTLFFVLSFPLVNSLPYFFGIFENIPHAPTALVLFLFYFLGWLIHKSRTGRDISARLPIFKPMLIFCLFLLVSLAIVIFRVTNFYPLLSDHPYELVANVNHVTSGGAMMSALFNFLNYTSGFLFFLIIVETAQSKTFVRKTVVVLLISTVLSLGFGAYQLFSNIKAGNLPRLAPTESINATFKDPLSLGAYLAAVIPLSLGVGLALKGWSRVLSFCVFVAGILAIPSTGSLSGLLGTSVSTMILFFLISWIAFRSRDLKMRTYRKLILAAAFCVVIVVAAAMFFVPKTPISFSKFMTRISDFEKRKDLDVLTSARYSYFWPMAVRMVQDYPLSGVGIGCYIIELPNYAKIHGDPRRTADSAENYFLQVGSELGIFALLYSLWLFWEILKQMRTAFRANLHKEGWNFLTIGISAGVLSLFVIYLFHTFIGSYEIKYTFWLLVGLVFCLRGSPEPGESGPGIPEFKARDISWNRPTRLLSAAAIIVAGASLLWNSTHSLSLASRTKLLGLKQDFGFYQQEKTNDGIEFRWTREYGGTTIKIQEPLMRIPLLAAHPDIQKKPVEVKIYLVEDFFKHKELLGALALTQGIWQTYEFDVSRKLGQEVILLVKVNRTWNPLKTLGTPDPRNLGVAMGKIEFKGYGTR